jgi:hypothetical protein
MTKHSLPKERVPCSGPPTVWANEKAPRRGAASVRCAGFGQTTPRSVSSRVMAPSTTTSGV